MHIIFVKMYCETNSYFSGFNGTDFYILRCNAKTLYKSITIFSMDIIDTDTNIVSIVSKAINLF